MYNGKSCYCSIMKEHPWAVHACTLRMAESRSFNICLKQCTHIDPACKDEDQDKPSQILLFGTHRGQEEKCKKEPIAEKNRRFSEILFPEFKEYVQYYNIGTKELIFLMNAKSPGEQKEAIAKTVRSIVTNQCQPDPSDLSLQWLGLEVVPEEITQALG